MRAQISSLPKTKKVSELFMGSQFKGSEISDFQKTANKKVPRDIYDTHN